MDSGERKDNNFNANDVSRDDVNKFENFLREAEFLATPAEEPVKRFLELTFGRRLQTFLTKVSDTEFKPIIVRAYYEQHKEDIAEIFRNETEFILEFFQLHLMDLVMFLNNDKIVKPMLNEQSEQMQETSIPDNSNAEQVQNVINSVKNSCQTYGDSLKDMARYSTGIDQRQIVLAELFRQVVVEFKNMFLQIDEREKTISKRDETIAERDKTIAKLNEQINSLNQKTNEQISTLNDKFSAATTRAGEYIEKIGKQQQQLEQRTKQVEEREEKVKELQELLKKQQAEIKKQLEDIEKWKLVNKALIRQNSNKVSRE